MINPIRILHVVVNMNRGGAESLIMNLYRKMDRTKIQFDFLTCKKGLFDKEIVKMGGRIFQIPYITEAGHKGYLRALDIFFAAHSNYKVIHSHMDKMSGLVLQRAQKFGIPFRVAHSHNTRSEGGIAARLYKWYFGTHIISSATHLLACSKAAAEWLFSQKSKEAAILPNGIETEKYVYSAPIQLEMREELGIAEDVLVIGHVGRFAHQKNHTYLIDMFASIQRIVPNAVLILAGDGPLRNQIEQKAHDLKLMEQTRFLGIRSDIERLLQAIDVFVFPSLHEGLPVTLIEAQCAGVPCLVSDRVSSEVDMGAGLIHFLKLKQPPLVWANKIITLKKEKQDAKSHIEENGYDIRSSANWLKSFYMEEVI